MRFQKVPSVLMIFLVLLRRPVRKRRRNFEIGHLALNVALARQVSRVHRLDDADHALHVGDGAIVDDQAGLPAHSVLIRVDEVGMVAAALRCEEVEEAKSLTLLGKGGCGVLIL